MDLEFHQLDRRYEALRTTSRERDSRVLASLARDGQQLPVVVVVDGDTGRYVLVDGYKRVRGLAQLGQDLVRATCWDLPEQEALLLGRLMRSGEGESALEQAWLLRELQERFGHLLVDEFQDTDPLQADILLLLAADDPAEDDPDRVRAVGGKLFLVGDPKQSIYRFRRADVSLYEKIKRRLEADGATVLQLSTSFRAAPAIQRLVNAAFASFADSPVVALCCTTARSRTASPPRSPAPRRCANPTRVSIVYSCTAFGALASRSKSRRRATRPSLRRRHPASSGRLPASSSWAAGSSLEVRSGGTVSQCCSTVRF